MSTWTCSTCHGPAVYPNRRCADCQAAVPTLFDAPRAGDARRTDPMPSKKGAGANLTIRQGQKKEILLRMLQGPVTSHDVSEFTGGQNGTASKRLCELRDAKLVVECGYQANGGRGGVPRTIYRLTDEGRRTISVMAAGVAS